MNKNIVFAIIFLNSNYFISIKVLSLLFHILHQFYSIKFNISSLNFSYHLYNKIFMTEDKIISIIEKKILYLYYIKTITIIIINYIIYIILYTKILPKILTVD